MKTIRFLAAARRELLADVLAPHEREVGLVKCPTYQVLLVTVVHQTRFLEQRELYQSSLISH